MGLYGEVGDRVAAVLIKQQPGEWPPTTTLPPSSSPRSGTAAAAHIFSSFSSSSSSSYSYFSLPRLLLVSSIRQ